MMFICVSVASEINIEMYTASKCLLFGHSLYVLFSSIVSCESLSLFPVLSPPADSRRKGSSGRCWGGRLGGVHLRHQRRGPDPRGSTEQDQSSNRHPLPHSQQVSHLTMYDATKESMIAHFPFYLGQTQWHKSPQNSTPFILILER